MNWEFFGKQKPNGWVHAKCTRGWLSVTIYTVSKTGWDRVPDHHGQRSLEPVLWPLL